MSDLIYSLDLIKALSFLEGDEKVEKEFEEFLNSNKNQKEMPTEFKEVIEEHFEELVGE